MSTQYHEDKPRLKTVEDRIIDVCLGLWLTHAQIRKRAGLGPNCAISAALRRIKNGDSPWTYNKQRSKEPGVWEYCLVLHVPPQPVQGELFVEAHP